MKERFLKIWVAITAIFSVMAAIPGVVAKATPTEAGVMQPVVDKGEYPWNPSTISVDIEAGNITMANLTAERSTTRWAGIYGNVSGTIVLGDADGKKMFTWTPQIKYIYFDNDTSVSWGNNWANITCAEMESFFPWLKGSDDCYHTFTTTENFNSELNGASLTDVLAAKTYKSDTTPFWITIALNNTADKDIVFVGVVNVDASNHPQLADAYNGDKAHYQVILPEDGESDNSPTPWYIWIELY